MLAACFVHVGRRIYNIRASRRRELLPTQTVTGKPGCRDHTQPVFWDADESAPNGSAAIVRALFDLWTTELPGPSGNSALAEAIRYATSRRTAIERFLSDDVSRSAPTPSSHDGGRTWAIHRVAHAGREDARCRFPLTWLTQTLQ